jgi:hypothetical protein
MLISAGSGELKEFRPPDLIVTWEIFNVLESQEISSSF